MKAELKKSTNIFIFSAQERNRVERKGKKGTRQSQQATKLKCTNLHRNIKRFLSSLLQLSISKSTAEATDWFIQAQNTNSSVWNKGKQISPSV